MLSYRKNILLIKQAANDVSRITSRFINSLPKGINMIRNVSARRIYLASSRSFACTSGRERTSQLESVVTNLPQQDVKLMLQPYYYTASLPNDTIRPELIRAYNYWTNLPDDVIDIIDEIDIMSYEAGVLPDDVDDDSDYRRGFPTAHKLFGVPRAEISSRAAQLYINNVLQLSLGEYKYLNYRDSMICPTMKEYRQMSIDRISPFVCLPLQILQILAGNKTDFTKLTDLVGVYLQYLNDTSNLCDQQTWHRKGYCSDISEGNYTIATIHALNSGTMEGNIVYNIIRLKTKDLPTIKYCVSLMEKLGSLDFAKEATAKVENELLEEIERLGGNPLFVKCINKVSTWRYDEVFPTDFKSPKLLNDFTL